MTHLIDYDRSIKFVDSDGKTVLRSAEFLRELVQQINLNSTLIGTGSPEGVISAEITKKYMDLSGVSGSILYIKQSGSGNTGWILV